MKNLLFTIFMFIFLKMFSQSEKIYFIKNNYIIDQYKLSEIDSLKYNRENDDTLLIYKQGLIIRKYSTNNQIDSVVFLNPQLPTKDVDGNVYHSVNINGKIWMTENLKTTRYNDGTPILKSSSNEEWQENSSNSRRATYSWYLDDSTTYHNPYGAYYNGFAVENKKLCPTGWHVATEKEWIDLRNYLGRNTLSKKLRILGYDYWIEHPWSSPTNEYGFNAVGAGERDSQGEFINFKRRAYIVGYRQSDISLHLTILYHDDNDEAYSNIDHSHGASVRCVQD